MTTVKLNISEKALDKVLWLLGHFSTDELEIVHEEDSNYLSNKKKINTELQRIKNGEANFLTLEEFDSKIREKLAKNED